MNWIFSLQPVILTNVVEQRTAMIEPESVTIVWMPMMTVWYAAAAAG